MWYENGTSFGSYYYVVVIEIANYNSLMNSRISRMSSNDDCSINKQTNSPMDYNSMKNFTISISSVAGQKWEESVTLCETIDSLKVTNPSAY